MTTTACGAASGPRVGTSLEELDGSAGTSTVVLGGGTRTFGLQVLTLVKGAAPVEVTGVQLVDAAGMTLIGARLAGPHRPLYEFPSAPGFPPRKYNRVSVPAIGTTLTPAKRGWEMLIGLRVTATGYPVMHGIRVEYRTVGHKEVEQQTLRITFVVCVATSQVDDNGRCHAPTRLTS